MLVTAAARGWNVDPATCDAKQGTVIHGETGRKQPYAALIDVAATLPVPTDVMLKDSKQFKVANFITARFGVRTSALTADDVAKMRR
jgi:isoquinoline 1-oxidoreductase subunit beta